MTQLKIYTTDYLRKLTSQYDTTDYLQICTINGSYHWSSGSPLTIFRGALHLYLKQPEAVGQLCQVAST